MFYVLIPQIEYSYEPQIVSCALYDALKEINENKDAHGITLLIRSYNRRQLEWYYKDVKYGDMFKDRSRLDYLSKFPQKILDASGFDYIESLDVQRYENHPDGLVYNMKYKVHFSQESFRVNSLVVQKGDFDFFSQANQYSSTHDTEPIVFHDLRRIHDRNKHRFFDTIESCRDAGVKHYFFPKAIDRLKHPSISYDLIQSYLDNQYGLYQLSGS